MGYYKSCCNCLLNCDNLNCDNLNEFYAHIIETDTFTRAHSIIFEAVRKKDIEMFVDNKYSEDYENINSENFKKAWRIFRNMEDKHNLKNNNEYQASKMLYLSEIDCFRIELSQSMDMIKKIKKSEKTWWRITVKPGGNFRITIGDALFMAFREELHCSLETISENIEKRLYDLFYFDLGNNIIGRPLKDSDPLLHRIGSYEFDRVEVLNVGAALTCRIPDTNGNNVLYFDMGIEFSNYKNPHPHNNYESAYCKVMWDAFDQNEFTLIISHWHTDHIMMLYRFINCSNYLFDFWNKMNIICPDINDKNNPCIYIAKIIGKLTNAKNRNVRVLKHCNSDINNVFNAQNISIIKCNKPKSSKNSFLHNNGIFMLVDLKNGKRIFLSGDCYYDTLSQANSFSGLLNNNNNGYSHLVASHHGGKYTNTAGKNRTNYIPIPDTISEDINICAFSANGKKHGHPNKNIMNAYSNVGWVCESTHRPHNIDGIILY